jgi:hypothetical protein
VKSIGVKATGGGEFGGGIENAGDDHGDDEIALTAGLSIENGIEVQFAQGAENGAHVTVRARAPRRAGFAM